VASTLTSTSQTFVHRMPPCSTRPRKL
jgi:hypothetical protein